MSNRMLDAIRLLARSNRDVRHIAFDEMAVEYQYPKLAARVTDHLLEINDHDMVETMGLVLHALTSAVHQLVTDDPLPGFDDEEHDAEHLIDAIYEAMGVEANPATVLGVLVEIFFNLNLISRYRQAPSADEMIEQMSTSPSYAVYSMLSNLGLSAGGD